MKLYAGNLPPTFNDDDLRDLFAPFGAVKSAKMILDHATGKSKGFGFVEMEDKEDAMKAMKELDKKVVGRSAIIVNEARPPKKRDNAGPPRGGPSRRSFGR